MTKFASQELDKVIVRLPDGMRDRLKAAAKKGNRTMNAEIVSRLEFSFATDIVVQESGWDVEHGHDTPEFKAAYKKSRESRAPSPRAFTNEDLDYLAGALASRLSLAKDK
jgi:hypothetical protein